MTHLRGQCRCGAVRYLVEDSFEYAFDGHCSNCHRVTGSAFKLIMGIALGKLQVTKGAAHLRKNGTEFRDPFCSLCRSRLYSAVRRHAYADVLPGSHVETPTTRPTSHIFVGSKVPRYEITDDLPQHHVF